jgi:hypothetical protein
MDDIKTGLHVREKSTVKKKNQLIAKITTN